MDNIVEIKQIIKDYLSSKNTDYSIMITGKWGTGKTYFLKKYLKPELNNKILYITLNGISELNEIDKLIVLGLYPIFESKGAKVAGGLASTALKFFKLDGLKDIVEVKDLQSNLSEKILCFDDIERSKIEIEQLLGYINKFVEHLSVKTLLICNERKINDSKTYKDIKEKLIGVTVEYMPDYRVVVDDIIDQYKKDDYEYFKFLSENKSLIYDIFKKSKTDNIRILKQSIIYYKKVFDTISKSAIEKVDDVLVFKFLLSTFFELRSGVIEEDEFYKYVKNSYSFWIAEAFNEEKKDKKTYIDEFLNKYYEGRDSKICLLVNVFNYIKTGYLNIEEFTKELNEKFSEKEQEVDNKTFLTENYWVLSDEEFSNACSEILEEIKNGEAFNQDYYLKLFYYFLYYSRKGSIKLSPKEILDLFTEGISKAQKEWQHKNIDINFIIAEEPKAEEYLLFKERLFDANNNLKKIDKEEKAKSLLDLMVNDFEDFIKQFRTIHSHDFIQIPVFKHWTPDEISEHILTFSNNQIVEFHKAFQYRYSIRNTWQHYIGEIDNLCEVVVKIKDYVEKNPGKLSSVLLLDLATKISGTQQELNKFKKETTQQIKALRVD